MKKLWRVKYWDKEGDRWEVSYVVCEDIETAISETKKDNMADDIQSVSAIAQEQTDLILL